MALKGMALRADNVLLPDFLQQGDYARLIPVISDSSREQRLTSVLLAVFRSVDEFGKTMLQIIKSPITKRSKIECFTEVVFKNGLSDKKFRPDGLIVVKSNSKTWSAIIEVKVGNTELTPEQIEIYLDIAKTNKIDAVITISNQFAALPHHHPISVNKRKAKLVFLYHWSWTSIVSQARLLAENKGISDPDQAFILEELIRHLEHGNSGVLSFARMGQSWKDLCTAIQQANPLSKNLQFVVDSVGDWHELAMFISLKMSLIAGRTVLVNIPRAYTNDPSKRLNDDIVTLLKNNCLETEFNIPNAAAHLKLSADISRRTLMASMRLKAPTDRSRASSLITWALHQVTKCEDDELVIKAIWPGRLQDTMANLGQLRSNPKAILYPNIAVLPIAFEFIRVLDIAARFKGCNTFVEHAVNIVPDFYRDIGQYLKPWIPPAPNVPPKSEVVQQSTPELTTVSDSSKTL